VVGFWCFAPIPKSQFPNPQSPIPNNKIYFLINNKYKINNFQKINITKKIK